MTLCELLELQGCACNTAIAAGLLVFVVIRFWFLCLIHIVLALYGVTPPVRPN